jgi:hypothetical protein
MELFYGCFMFFAMVELRVFCCCYVIWLFHFIIRVGNFFMLETEIIKVD